MELSDDLVEFHLEEGYEDPGLDIPEYEDKFYAAHAIFSNAIKDMEGQDHGQDQSNILLSSTVERLFEGQNNLLEKIHTSSGTADLRFEKIRIPTFSGKYEDWSQFSQPLTSVPELSFLDVNINRLQRWRQLQAKVQGFWKRWNLEYLSRLQPCTKWHQDAPNVAMDTLVVLKEPNQPPSKWILGRVTEVHPGQDQRVRVVTVKTAKGIYKRHITKISVLPLN
ncbi:hypothetical protein KR074_004420 [Drosophila pseudoananassae]|nr:hypothetical protein KR074_004420 [Drosophila pseudoananassae]